MNALHRLAAFSSNRMLLSGALSLLAFLTIPTMLQAQRDTVLHHIGDAYTTPEFKTKYLGMAMLPTAKSASQGGGACFTLLFEATYLATPGSRSLFSPAVTGFLKDGREARKDESGADCRVGGMKALGYEAGSRRGFAKGETARVFVGAIYVPAADSGKLAYATLYRDASASMVAKVIHDISKP